MVFTGTHPDRFVSHAEVRWLQEGGATVRPSASAAPRPRPRAGSVNRTARAQARHSARRRCGGPVQLERVHQTFLKMNRSGVIFIAALNGSALGLGAEFSWANDLRVMADGDYVIGQPEVLLGIMPGGGGSQRLPRLIGNHKPWWRSCRASRSRLPRPWKSAPWTTSWHPTSCSERAIELAQHLGSRPEASRAAIKRSVYFGGSAVLEEGLHIERAEFLATALSHIGQELMRDYMANTTASGELPLYQPGVFDEVLQAGTTRGAGALRKAARR